MAYWTKHGGLNMHPEIKAENHPLFVAYYWFWRILNKRPPIKEEREKLFVFAGDTWNDMRANYFQANIGEKGQHFSRDNMYGMYFIFIILGMALILPIFKWNGEFRPHPNQWAVFLSLKSKAWGVILFPLVAAMFIWSQLRHAFDPNYTTGPCLWTPTKYFLWGKSPTMSDIRAFRYYCTHGGEWDLMPGHPILEEIKEYENNQFRPLENK